jgi:hypothetical protein
LLGARKVNRWFECISVGTRSLTGAFCKRR